MKIKALLLILVICLLLCSCGADQQPQVTDDDIDVTTTEDQVMDETPTTTLDESEDDIPSLFVTEEETTEVDLDDLFESIWGELGSIQLPEDTFGPDVGTPAVPVTTVPPTEPGQTTEPPVETTTQGNSSSFVGGEVLPEDTWTFDD